jgi:hypothetical protein
MKLISILPIIMLMCFAGITNAQQNTQKKKLTKEERKALRKQKDEENLLKIQAILESKQWIVEANTVLDRNNQSYQLNPTINFVGVDREEGALQLGFDGLVGWNGVGGVTVDGKVTRYEIKEARKNRAPQVDIRFQGKGGVGSATINLTINTSFQATARVNGDFGERITFQGMLVPLQESRVYKGQSLF